LGLEGDEVSGDWRKLRNEQLHALYSSPNIISVIKSRRTRWAGNVESVGERKGTYRVVVEITEGKRPLGRPRLRCEDDIKMNLLDVG
jgi:hypothetical protein